MPAERDGLFRKFVKVNMALSNAFDRLLPTSFSVDGHTEFKERVLPDMFAEGQSVYDLGGGSRPYVTHQLKDRYALTLTGLDESEDELNRAPDGVYDAKIAEDLSVYNGRHDADLVICQSTLEHVRDVKGAVRGIASCLKPGARAAIFVPCRNAVYARINILLPEGLKRRILFALFPEKAHGHDGFEAHYDHCTPRTIEALGQENGMVVEQRYYFWSQPYFTPFAPAHAIWRIWNVLARTLIGREMCETFILIFRKAE